jgi:hypothetical protein
MLNLQNDNQRMLKIHLPRNTMTLPIFKASRYLENALYLQEKACLELFRGLWLKGKVELHDKLRGVRVQVQDALFGNVNAHDFDWTRVDALHMSVPQFKLALQTVGMRAEVYIGAERID